MIVGLGVDIVEIDRMATALRRRPRMKERLFSEEERKYCDARGRPEVHYALRFAAKEAVLKALGTGFAGMRFTDVEVIREANGRPVPQLSGRAAERAAELGVIEMHLSLSFTHTTAVASAVALTEGARPMPKPEPHDPMADLAASFKEARAMLDDIGKDEMGEE
jgi:holo-[acyl-carrier protein] synthase